MNDDAVNLPPHEQILAELAPLVMEVLREVLGQCRSTVAGLEGQFRRREARFLIDRAALRLEAESDGLWVDACSNFRPAFVTRCSADILRKRRADALEAVASDDPSLLEAWLTWRGVR